MDLYDATLTALAGDRATRVAYLPRDIVGIIRRMYPHTYSFAFVAEMLDAYQKESYYLSNYGVSVERHILFLPKYRALWLYRESEAPDKLMFWVDFCDGADDLTRTEVKRLALRMYGQQFWDNVVHTLADINDYE